MDPLAPERLVAGCQQVARTWDATATSPIVWQAIGAPFVTGYNTVTAAAEAPSDPNVVYAIEQFGNVWVTRNAGTSPSATPNPTPSWSSCL